MVSTSSFESCRSTGLYFSHCDYYYPMMNCSALYMLTTPTFKTHTHRERDVGELLSLLSQLRNYKEPWMCFQWLVKAQADFVFPAQTQPVWQQLLKAAHLYKAECTKVLQQWVAVSLCWSHSGQCLFTSHVSHNIASRPSVFILWRELTEFGCVAESKERCAELGESGRDEGGLEMTWTSISKSFFKMYSMLNAHI